MNKIYVFCNGGFGNRFYSLLTGLYVAYRVGRDPTVIWPVNNWCGAAFDQIFHSPVQFDQDIDYQTLINSKQTVNVLHNNFFDPGISWIPAIHTPIDAIVHYIGSTDLDAVIGTDSLPPYVEPSVIKFGLMPLLEFQQDIVDRADQIKKHQAKNQVFYGLHLRKTDAYRYANEHRLFNIVDNNPEQLFFVCSDDAATEQEFNRRSNVFIHDKDSYVEKLVNGNWRTEIVDDNGNRFPFNVNRSCDSVRQAMVDLLLLSHSDLQYNESNLSSFLTVAQLLQSTYDK